MSMRAANAHELHQRCDHCGAEHTLPLKSGYSKSKKGPFVVADGDTLIISVDGGTPQVMTLDASAFDNIGATTAAELAPVVKAALPNASADVDHGALRIVSQSEGVGISSIEVRGGIARTKLGFDGRPHGPRVLGVTKGKGPHRQTFVDAIDLPHCPECGAKESLLRTHDQCPPGHAAFNARRRCTNALAEYLKREGYSDPHARPIHAAETRTPSDIEPNFPATSIRLPAVGGAQ